MISKYPFILFSLSLDIALTFSLILSTGFHFTMKWVNTYFDGLHVQRQLFSAQYFLDLQLLVFRLKIAVEIPFALNWVY